MKGDAKPLPRSAATAQELERLSADLHDWWLDLGRASLGDSEYTLPLEAEGTTCGENDDWSVSRAFENGSQQWEAPPPSYSARLAVSGVTSVHVDDPVSVGDYTLTEIRFKDDTLTIRAEPSASVTLQVSDLRVRAEAADK